MRATCVRQAGGADGARPQAALRLSSGLVRSDHSVRALLDASRADVEACFAPPHGPLAIDIVIATSEAVTSSACVEGCTPLQQACIDAAFVQRRAPGQVVERRTVRFVFPARGELQAAALAVDAEAVIRARLDTHRLGILACVQADAVAVAAAWELDGNGP